MSDVYVRKASERGAAEFGWLSSRHSFSFGSYYDPNHMGFSALRVINDDRVAPGAGFPTHPHRDMEILSYVLDGALEHRDSMGHGGVVGPGDVQYMSAGRGVTHSEYNPSKTEPLRFLQIWILPNVQGEAPEYRSVSLRDKTEGTTQPTLIASADGRDGSIRIKQETDFYAVRPRGDTPATFELKAGRRLWIHVAKGELQLAGTAVDDAGVTLNEGDGVAIDSAEQARTISLTGNAQSEALLFDLP